MRRKFNRWQLLLVLGWAASTGAATIHVPADVPTIQAGLDLAQAGDVVEVSPGTYPECVQWPATQGITLRGVGGPESVILDAQGKGRCLDLPPNLDGTTRITGMTFTGGRVRGHGSAIRCYESAPLIQGNVFRGNDASYDVPETLNGVGGAVTVRGAPAVIRENLFEDNLGGVGGAVYTISAPVLIEDNIFRRNQASNGGGAIMVLHRPSPIIRGNLFEENETPLYGGAIWCHYRDASIIEGNRFLCNQARGGGAISADQSSTWIRSNLFVGNGAEQDGGAVSSYVGAPTMLWNTLAGNWAERGGACALKVSSGLVSGNILATNEAGEAGGIFLDEESTTLVWANDFWANWPPDHAWQESAVPNLEADPLFVQGQAGAFCLSQTAAGQAADSPCLDAGLELAVPGGSTRTDGGGDQLRPDLGYHHGATRDMGLQIAFWTRRPRPEPGDDFRLDLVLSNPGPSTEARVWLFAVIDGVILYAPDWDQTPGSIPVTFEPHLVESLPLVELDWPADLLPGEVLMGALATDPTTGALLAGPGFLRVAWS